MGRMRAHEQAGRLHDARMPAFAPLPEPLADGPFTTADAIAAGVTPRRLRGADLSRPFFGVRRAEQPVAVTELAASFAVRMRPGHAFAGITAARLWGLPVPRSWVADEALVIGVPAGTTRTRARGTRTREFDASRLDVVTLDGLRLLEPAAAVLTMADRVTSSELVVLVDALLTPLDHYPGLRLRRPAATPETLASFLERCRGMRGVAAMRAALVEARVGAESPQETRARLCIVAAGLPEPVVQHEVWVAGERRAVLDLAYPELRIAIEYEGEHHLLDPGQWAKDIARQDLLESLGWIVVRATKADLRHGGQSLVRRVRAARDRRA